jgi:4-hydroxy-tetrahydrodipicolinate synthase
MGAVGWIAGLVNALPRETMALFRAASSGDTRTADAIYEWFLPLLRMDTLPKFVQLIKLVQQEVDMGHERVRGPRLILAGHEREDALEIIRNALQRRPTLQ